MKFYQTVLPVSLVIFISICSISYFTINHIHSLIKLKETANKYRNIEHDEFIDINNKQAKEKLLQKIRHYESIERDPIRHLVPLNLLNEENNQNLRKLSSFNTFDNVAIVELIYNRLGTAGRWITNNIKQYEPNIIIYPYSFDYSFKINETEKINHYSRGAFISLNPSSLNEKFIPDTFGIKTNSTLSVEKSKALYDTDIAILSIETILTDYKQDLFQDAQDWCSFFQTFFYRTNGCLSNYNEFYTEKLKNSSKTYIIRINETSINEGKLISEDGYPRFGILIIPDYKLGTDGVIKKLLSNKGIENLKNYYNKGGYIIATGKSGTLLEDFNFISKGLYDRTKLFSSDLVNRNIIIKGCQELENKTYSKTNSTEYKKQMLCIGFHKWVRAALSTTFKMKKTDSDLIPLLDIDPNSKNLILTDIDYGISENLTAEEKSFIPLILNKINPQSNGQLLILNFNPVYGGADKFLAFNSILLALSKEMYMTTKVNMFSNSVNIADLPIPAGENGVQLTLNILFHNLNDETINDFQMYLFLPEHFKWITIPDICNRKNDFNSLPLKVSSKKTFNDTSNDYLICKINSISTYEKKNFNLSIIVTDYQATQNKYSVLILIPVVLYTDSEKNENIMTQYVRVNAEDAPVLRVTINPDPSSYYPIKGEGQYVDNSVKIENKESSNAIDVEYIGLIPIISPLTDSENQSKISWNLKLFVDYYNSNNFEVPLESDDASDYIYTNELNNKGIILCAEWDSPVLPIKEINTNVGIGKKVNITGINFGMVTINSTSENIRQVNYRKSERFYKLASQRLLVFVDDTSPEGAKTLYGDNIPNEWKDPVLGDRAKKQFLFLRNDIYFYDNENYVNPPNVSEKIIFSIDKYIPYEKNKNGCVNNRGQASSTISHKGYFTNKESDKKSTILDPNTYTNALFEFCDLTIVDPLSEESIKKVFENTNNFRPVHYIVPNIESTITQPKQIYGFIQEDNYHGYLEQYPSLKFIYLHSLNYIIDTKNCFYGGMIEINLGDKDLLNIDDVTVSPDQIAVYKKEYNDHIIKIED